LYGCETLPLTVREKHRLIIFENRGGEYFHLRESVRRLEKPYNEELHNLYTSPNIIRVIKSRMRWQGM
jgi:hypothetical protein